MLFTEPVWLGKPALLALHAIQIDSHGGIHGIRSEDLLDSALARPLQLFSYGDRVTLDLASLATAYAYGLVKNHPFLDGNKRVGFIASLVFLETNGIPVRISQDAATAAVLSLAAGEMVEQDFAGWLRGHLGKTRNGDRM